jgi:hypothetical protein
MKIEISMGTLKHLGWSLWWIVVGAAGGLLASTMSAILIDDVTRGFVPVHVRPIIYYIQLLGMIAGGYLAHRVYSSSRISK